MPATLGASGGDTGLKSLVAPARTPTTIYAMIVLLSLIAFGSFSSRPLHAASSIFVGASADSALDRTGEWTIKDVMGPEGASRFQAADGRRPANYGAVNGPNAAMWLRLSVPSGLATDGGAIILTLRETRARSLSVYWSRHGSVETRHWVLGIEPANARLITRYPSIALPETLRGQTIFVRLHTPSSMRATLWVQNETSYLRTYAAEMIFFGVLFGVLLALLVYFSAAAIGSRDPTTGTLALLTLSFLLHIVGNQAFFETYLFPGAADASRVLSITATFSIYTLSLFYAVQALQTRVLFPRADRILALWAGGLAVLTVVSAISIATGIFTLRYLSPAIGLSTIGLVIGLAVATAIYQPHRALVFVLCWGPALATGVARLLPDFIPQDGFNPVLINLLYPAFATSLLLAGIAAASDIRERQDALTRAAFDNAARLKAFADSASDSFWETDREGRLTFASGPACLTAGLKVGLSIQSVLLDRDGVSLQQGRGLSRAPITRTSEGQGTRHLRLSAVPIAEGGWRGIVSDVTDEVAEAERMHRQRRMAAVGQMAGGVAHEINNLLHPMINLSRRAGEKMEEGDERRSWLEVVRSSGLRAAEIVTALLSSVRPLPNAGKRLPMGAALQEISTEVRALIPESAQFDTHIATDAGPLVSVSEVFQVVTNLVANALHASRGGSVKVIYACANAGATFNLTVADNGSGMDEATLVQVLEPFFTTKPQGEGTGLGLSIVQGIASKWGGEIKISSRLGEGTEVTVSVPLERPSLTREDAREHSRSG